jgi:hypothetical protein
VVKAIPTVLLVPRMISVLFSIFISSEIMSLSGFCCWGYAEDLVAFILLRKAVFFLAL